MPFLIKVSIYHISDISEGWGLQPSMAQRLSMIATPIRIQDLTIRQWLQQTPHQERNRVGAEAWSPGSCSLWTHRISLGFYKMAKHDPRLRYLSFYLRPCCHVHLMICWMSERPCHSPCLTYRPSLWGSLWTNHTTCTLELSVCLASARHSLLHSHVYITNTARFLLSSVNLESMLEPRTQNTFWMVKQTVEHTQSHF